MPSSRPSKAAVVWPLLLKQMRRDVSGNLEVFMACSGGLAFVSGSLEAPDEVGAAATSARSGTGRPEPFQVPLPRGRG